MKHLLALITVLILAACGGGGGGLSARVGAAAATGSGGSSRGGGAGGGNGGVPGSCVSSDWELPGSRSHAPCPDACNVGRNSNLSSFSARAHVEIMEHVCMLMMMT